MTMGLNLWTTFVVWLLLHLVVVHARRANDCQRTPASTAAAKSAGSNGFHLNIRELNGNASMGEPNGYVPGESYMISLMGYKAAYTVQTFRAFSLVAVDEEGTETTPIGQFSLRAADHLSSHSPQCPHGVSQNNYSPKTQITVIWHAPAEPSPPGCVLFKAMVLEYTDSWYMDDGMLTKQFCLLERPSDKVYCKLGYCSPMLFNLL